MTISRLSGIVGVKSVNSHPVDFDTEKHRLKEAREKAIKRLHDEIDTEEAVYGEALYALMKKCNVHYPILERMAAGLVIKINSDRTQFDCTLPIDMSAFPLIFDNLLGARIAEIIPAPKGGKWDNILLTTRGAEYVEHLNIVRNKPVLLKDAPTLTEAEYIAEIERMERELRAMREGEKRFKVQQMIHKRSFNAAVRLLTLGYTIGTRSGVDEDDEWTDDIPCLVIGQEKQDVSESVREDIDLAWEYDLIRLKGLEDDRRFALTDLGREYAAAMGWLNSSQSGTPQEGSSTGGAEPYRA